MRFVVIVSLLLVFAGAYGPKAAADELHVFAAASLKNALDDVGRLWHARSGNMAVVTVASSSAIARQIEQGAPADVFISANPKWMDYLSDAGVIDSASRVDLLGNSIVLVAQDGDRRDFDIGPHFDLAAALDGGRLSIGATQSVPAGVYARAALENLGLWDDVKDHLAEAENVRAALALVSLGEAPLGIVYATDAAVDNGVRVAGRFPEGSYPPIIYPAALVTDANVALGADFMSFLQSAEAAEVFRAAGFSTRTSPTN